MTNNPQPKQTINKYSESGYTVKGRPGKYWIDDIEQRLTHRFYDTLDEVTAEVKKLAAIKRNRVPPPMGPSVENLIESDHFYSAGGGVPAVDPYEGKSISYIAGIIYNDWKPVGYAAKPYLQEMFRIDNITDTLGPGEDGRYLVAYFLNNAQSWKGDTARAVKAHLNKELKASGYKEGGTIDGITLNGVFRFAGSKNTYAEVKVVGAEPLDDRSYSFYLMDTDPHKSQIGSFIVNKKDLFALDKNEPVNAIVYKTKEAGKIQRLRLLKDFGRTSASYQAGGGFTTAATRISDITDKIDIRTATYKEISAALRKAVETDDRALFDAIWRDLYNDDRDKEIVRLVMSAMPTEPGKEITDIFWEQAKKSNFQFENGGGVNPLLNSYHISQGHYQSGGAALNPKNQILIKPHNAHIDDYKDLLIHLRNKSLIFRTDAAPADQELDYVFVSTLGLPRDEVEDLRKYLKEKSWDWYENTFESGGGLKMGDPYQSEEYLKYKADYEAINDQMREMQKKKENRTKVGVWFNLQSKAEGVRQKMQRVVFDNQYEKLHQKTSFEAGGPLKGWLTIAEIKEVLDKEFPDSFSFALRLPKEGTRQVQLLPDFDKGGLNGITDKKIRLSFPPAKHRGFAYHVYQGGENTYFEFALDGQDNEEYIGSFGFKDDGDVSREYITRFVVFLHEAFGLPFTVKQQVMANGGGMGQSVPGQSIKDRERATFKPAPRR